MASFTKGLLSAGISKIEFLAELSVPLLAGVLLGVVWCNFDPASYSNFKSYSFWGNVDLSFLINEIFLVFFFGLAAKEIVESCLPGGSLNPIKLAINPILGTFGGVIGPALVYLICVWLLGRWDLYSGWAVPTATDIALAWLVARGVFGKDHPAINYLLLLAIIDDGLGLLIIALFYPSAHGTSNYYWLLLVLVGVLIAVCLKYRKAESHWYYTLIAGPIVWFGLYKSHVHPALALVPIVPFMPSALRDQGIFVEYSDSNAKRSTLENFAKDFKLPVECGMFFFGLVNSGVQLVGMGTITYSVLVALLIGKTAGVFIFSKIATSFGYTLPKNMNTRDLVLVGMIAGIGLTVSLFLSGVAFQDPVNQSEARLGALLSLFIAPLVLILSRFRFSLDTSR